MAISPCEESDGKEESGPDCCTTSCGKGCLQNPSLNPSRLCTQRLLHAPQLPEEERSVAVEEKEVEEDDDEEGEADDDDDADDADDADDDAVIDPPSPSNLRKAFTETQEVDRIPESNSNEDAECSSPHDQCTDMAFSTTPSLSPPCSSELYQLRPLALSAPYSPPTSSPGIDQGDINSLFGHTQRQQKDSALDNKHLCSSAASLDPNAREFVPIASPSASRLLQPQTRPLHSCSTSLHHQVGTRNPERVISVAYETVQPLNPEMGAAFYSIYSAPSEMGYHNQCIAEVGYNQGGPYEDTDYAPQMGYAATPGVSLLAPAWHDVGLPRLPAAAPQSAPLVAMSPHPSPSLCPPAASMEAKFWRALQLEKHLPGYHSFGSAKEHVSRTLLISGLPPHISEAQLRGELERWGDLRGIQADAHPQGLQVMVQFFDLRSARQALRDMQNLYTAGQQHQPLHEAGLDRMPKYHSDEGFANHGRLGVLCGSVVLAQYIGSCGMAVPDAHNQGTLVLFNVGADVHMQDIRKKFETYGHVREVREAPAKRQHKFVEFYDVRAAATAWSALNGKDICGKCVKIEFSRQGGAAARRQKTQQDKAQQDIGSDWSSAHAHIVDPHSWHGNATTYGLSLYSTGLQAQGWPSQEGAPGHFPVNVCVTGGPYELSMPIYPDSGAALHGDMTGRIGDNVGIPSGGRGGQQGHPESSRVAVVAQPHGAAKERFAGVSRHSKGHTHYQFDEDEMNTHANNPRTTLMIQNIPNKYSQKMLLTLLDQHCLQFNSNLGAEEPEAAYDFMYLPIDFKNKCNLGYAFVNFTTPQATLGFYKVFHGKAWEEFNSRKICGVAFARLQGRSALEEHFRNSRFACDTEEYLPVLFVPPRNGTNQSLPRVAVGQLGLVRGVRSGNDGLSFFSNDPCNQHDKVISDSSSGSGSGSSSPCEAQQLGVEEVTPTSEAQLESPAPEMDGVV